jgi:hypothetical protein
MLDPMCFNDPPFELNSPRYSQERYIPHPKTAGTGKTGEAEGKTSRINLLTIEAVQTAGTGETGEAGEKTRRISLLTVEAFKSNSTLRVVAHSVALAVSEGRSGWWLQGFSGA